MHLKTLEVRGFKSFADKTLIEFNEGITCVVGPNGSGKSNISDSVKWVLGEQSVKNLRGGTMQDVIFAGTQYRKPVGLAQVSLTLDNSDSTLQMDYDEVKVTRKLFRSGDSEYYINNTKCRLRDVHELFMDTGIGKEGYSIIGQGKIEAILSGKPEDRRSLLEEAAGIVKFKARKSEAERKLENTLKNIQRINDIFSTYEDRLEPLEKESEKAKQFLILSEELEYKEINILIHSIDEIQSKIEVFKRKLEEIESQIIISMKEKDKLKNELNNFNNNIEILEKEKDLDKENYYNKKTKIQNIENEIKIENEKIGNSHDKINSLTKEIDEQIEKGAMFLAEFKKLEKELLELNKQKKDTDELVQRLSSKIHKLDYKFNSNEEVLSFNKEKIVNLISMSTNYKNDLKILNNNILNEEDKLDRQKKIIKNHVENLEFNKSEIIKYNIEINQCKKEIIQLQEHLKDRKKQINNKNTELREINNKCEKIISVLNKNDANLRFLIDLENKHEGYNRATKVLMQHIQDKKIHINEYDSCILGDIIEVDKTLEVAVEIALGGSISNIITKNDHVAKLLIQYLRDNKLGRATFLPLNTIKGSIIKVNEETKLMDGYIGIASKIIKFNPKYEIAINYVLGRTVIVDNMDNALAIAKKNNFNLRIVTLLGEVINSGGSLTGGSSFSKNLNIMSRKRKIQELKDDITLNDRLLKSLRNDSEKINFLINKLGKISLEINDKIKIKNFQMTKIIEKIELIKNDERKINKEVAITEEELEEINKIIKYNQNESKVIEIKISEIEEKISSCQKIIEKTEISMDEINSGLSEDRLLLGNKRVEQARIDEIINGKNNDFSRIIKEINECNNFTKVKEERVKNLKNEIFIFKENIEKNNRLIEISAEEINRLDHKLLIMDEKKLKIKEKTNLLSSQYDNISELLDKNEKSKQKLIINLTKNETELESKYIKLNDEMALTYAEALEFKDEDADLNKFLVDITKCKNSIKNLGIVNVAAIEEFKELKEKYTFLKEQKNDLLSAKEEIEEIIDDMTKEMKSLFNDNFDKLRESFNQTFKELFKGGNADLILGDGDELDANIEINVQPPGKKLQNLNLMSGGEKGLSAIALLFAIQKMKPSPFCILDEIEAALDDANVVRFAEFLTRFSINTQFIIITHRKGTMEVGNALYGITMEEKGVSKVVSVDLNKYSS
ncbi:chromosome segregation protein SMC [Clostridium sp. DL1XJH146]